MRAKEIRDRSNEELLSIERQMAETLFKHRLKNSTNQLTDSSQIRKVKRDLARVKTIIRERGLRS